MRGFDSGKTFVKQFVLCSFPLTLSGNRENFSVSSSLGHSSTMDLPTFRQALIRCGITQALARTSIVDQGYTDMQVFARLLANDRAVSDFVKAVNKLPADQAGIHPSIPFASIRKLQAMRHWTIERIRMGEPVVHNEMTEDELDRILARMVEEEEIMEMKPVPPPLPDKFKAFGTSWRTFSDGFYGHCAVVRSTMNIPLAYILREHEIPTPEMVAEAYTTTDLRLMNLVRLDGREAKKDNTLVWQLLRPLVLDTPAWNYVKQHDTTQNGRMAFLTLQTRGEGEAALDARRTAAEETIQKAKFTGKSKRFTLQNYINLLQGAFTELEACGEDYKLSEKQKVTIFVRGLQSDEYAATKHSIYQNPETREDFQKCYSFVETMERFRPSYSDPNSFDRNISEASRRGGGNLWKSPEEWAALSPEEKSKITAARKQQRGRKGGKKGKKPEATSKRKLEAAITTAAEAITAMAGESTTDTASGISSISATAASASSNSPGDQFGRRTQELKKILKTVAAAATGGKKSSEE
jgi:hypothetical protein